MKLIHLIKVDLQQKKVLQNYLLQKLYDSEIDTNNSKIIICNFNEDPLIVDEYLLKDYPNIIGFNALVGDNGSGKTSLIKNILNFFEDDLTEYLNISFIGIFFDSLSSKFYYYHDQKFTDIYEHIDWQISDELHRITKIQFNQLTASKKIFYYNPSLNKNDFFENHSNKFHDESLGSALKKLHTDDERDVLEKYFAQEILRQLKLMVFLNNSSKNERILPENLVPDSLIINLKQLSSNKINLANKIRDIYSIHPGHLVEKIVQINEINFESIDKKIHYINYYFFKEIFFSAYIYALENGDIFVNPLHENINSVFDKLIAVNKESTSDSITHLFEKLLSILSQVYFIDNKESTSFINYYTKQFSDLIHCLEILNEESHIKNFLIEDDYFRDISSFEVSLKKFSTEDNTLSKLLKSYFKSFNSPFLDFDWNLSTGENHLLNLYSILYGYFNILEKSLTKNKKNVIYIFIDEADISFHPRWQSKYIYSILYFLSSTFKNLQIQLFVATHSPIILSDFPHYNVLYMKDNSVYSTSHTQKTFGQNIHNLFSNSFFLDRVSGSFSEQIIIKIEKAIIELRKIQEKDSLNVKDSTQSYLNDLSKVVNIIGESVIQKTFNTQLDSISKNVHSEDLTEMITLYSNLNLEERKSLIQYIINESKAD